MGSRKRLMDEVDLRDLFVLLHIELMRHEEMLHSANASEDWQAHVRKLRDTVRFELRRLNSVCRGVDSSAHV